MIRQRPPIERILCPTDFSLPSKQALERAVRLTRWFHAQLTVLHVVPPVQSGALGGRGVSPGAGPVDIARMRCEREARELEQIVRLLRGEGISVETEHAQGSPALEILAAMKAVSADLIVMGKNGTTKRERSFLGSVTETVARRAVCPVLIEGSLTPLQEVPVFRRIVCAADLTAPDSTLEMALPLAEEGTARVMLLHVIDDLPRGCDSPAFGSVPELGRLRRQYEAEARARLASSVHAAQGRCHLAVRVDTGTPWEDILRVAKETSADLIAIGAHTGGAMSRILCGSTARHVLQQADCPVLVVGHAMRRPTQTMYAPSVHRLDPEVTHDPSSRDRADPLPH